MVGGSVDVMKFPMKKGVESTGLTNPHLMAGSLFVAGMIFERLAMILNFPIVHLYSILGNLFCLEVKGRHVKHIMTFPCSCLTFHIPSFC